MKKFYLYRKQHGEGCDYTIGCGTDLMRLDSDTFFTAMEEAQRLLMPGQDGNGLANPEGGVDECLILSLEADAMGMVREAEAALSKERDKAQEKAIDAEIARLQKMKAAIK